MFGYDHRTNAFQTSAKIDVFEQLGFAKSADLLKNRPPDEDRLISRGYATQARTNRDQPGDQPQERTAGVKAQVEASPTGLAGAQQRDNLASEARR